jgi:hypothetical protein
MSEVVEFPGEKTAEARAEAGDARIIAMLEDVLRRARAGEISAAAVAYVENDGSTYELWSAPWRQSQLLSAIALMQHRYTEVELERSRLE